jgi:anthranilate phosphoribosyltransferase
MSTQDFTQAAAEHAFAPFVRILGKGKSGSRSLSQAEAQQAFSMILRAEVEPLQLGAFLMLLRVKEESPEELAGFVQACRDAMLKPPQPLAVDLDWSSYAGKRRQLPWFVLSALLLAQAGYRVLIHGCDGHTPDRLYTEQAMRALNLPVAGSWEACAAQLDQHQLSYLPLRAFLPELNELMLLRPLLGLRSPVNTLARLLNPLRAAHSIQSVFHPAYGPLHQAADTLLGQSSALVFKGDSGEVEVKPQADTQLLFTREQCSYSSDIPRCITERVDAEPELNPQLLAALWRGDHHHRYGEAAVIRTCAAALLLLQPEWGLAQALEYAQSLWQQRKRDLI